MNTAITADDKCAAGDGVPRPLALLAALLVGALALTFFLVVLLRPADLLPAEHSDMSCWTSGIRAENVTDEFPADDVLPCPQSIT